jgi:hypothetical protein
MHRGMSSPQNAQHSGRDGQEGNRVRKMRCATSVFSPRSIHVPTTADISTLDKRPTRLPARIANGERLDVDRLLQGER